MAQMAFLAIAIKVWFEDSEKPKVRFDTVTLLCRGQFAIPNPAQLTSTRPKGGPGGSLADPEASPWPKTRRITRLKLNAATCTSRRLRMFGRHRRCTRRIPPVSYKPEFVFWRFGA